MLNHKAIQAYQKINPYNSEPELTKLVAGQCYVMQYSGSFKPYIS